MDPVQRPKQSDSKVRAFTLRFNLESINVWEGAVGGIYTQVLMVFGEFPVSPVGTLGAPHQGCACVFIACV